MSLEIQRLPLVFLDFIVTETFSEGQRDRKKKRGKNAQLEGETSNQELQKKIAKYTTKLVPHIVEITNRP